MTNLDEFKRGYVAALEWLTIDCPDWTLDQMTEYDEAAGEDVFKKGYSEQIWQDGTFEWSMSNETLKRIDEDCETFFNNNLNTLEQAIGMETNANNPMYRIYNWAQAGHDYWLTRNGHGAGFWDRGLGEIGDVLTKACEYTEVHAYLGDDGLIYTD